MPQKIRILVRITDDLSGVNTLTNHKVGSSFLSTDPKSFDSFGFSVSLKPVGNDWYSFDVPVDGNAKPGEYLLGGLGCSDNADNVASLYTTDRLHYFDIITKQPSSIPLLKIRVKNRNWHESGKRLTRPRNISISTSPQANGAAFSLENYRIAHKVGHATDGDFEYGISSRLPYAGDNWYAYAPDFKEYLPPGEYYLRDLTVSDKAGNYLYLNANLEDGTYHASGPDNLDLGPTGIAILKVNLTR